MQNAHSGEESITSNKCSRTTNEVAKEFGVAARTVDDAYAFHKGMEVVEKEDKQLASDILNGKEQRRQNDATAQGRVATIATLQTMLFQVAEPKKWLQ